MSQSLSCSADWSMQVDNYNFACIASFAFTAIATSLYICCLKSRLDGAPQLAAQFFTVIGTVKFILVLTIFAVFFPQCADGCTCGTPPLLLYPFFASFVAVRWLFRARQLYALANRVASENEDKDGPIFDRVSTVELA
ncbi:hypothetical protein FisN_24Hh193 [Fistulifera solaris]|uniref:THH1/TOM1/TOM3 domain-containing protein n=1 Tax=Fistulifera solaris TaxID=1519565 RepID=A0A1Z5JVH3_FISSO|nr:hypothetical protein FisN_24Hh193 [Fistulifera solaris]|eukprot:GAX17741.1 hypothetical protein FisN_24Hh193 [Fistulifera solaris]